MRDIFSALRVIYEPIPWNSLDSTHPLVSRKDQGISISTALIAYGIISVSGDGKIASPWASPCSWFLIDSGSVAPYSKKRLRDSKHITQNTWNVRISWYHWCFSLVQKRCVSFVTLQLTRKHEEGKCMLGNIHADPQNSLPLSFASGALACRA